MHSSHPSRVVMLMCVVMTVLFISSIAFAQQARIQVPLPSADRVPVPIPPAPVAKCPGADEFSDAANEPFGSGLDVSYAAALGEAINECNLAVPKARNEQAAEIAWNKPRCEAVPGCTLKYQHVEVSCSSGAGPGSCDSPSVDQHETQFQYYCHVWGYVDSTFYRCDRGAKLPWEQVA